MIAPLRLTAVLTHPIQYYAPWFRHIQAHAPQIDLTVVYATQPTPEQQGVGFGRSFEYYSGFVFEVQSPALKSDRGVGGGGRYDGLVKAAGAERDVPAVGAAVHSERLLLAVRGGQ